MLNKNDKIVMNVQFRRMWVGNGHSYQVSVWNDWGKWLKA